MPSQTNQSTDTGKYITSLADIKKTTAMGDTFANLNNTSLHVHFNRDNSSMNNLSMDIYKSSTDST